MLTIITITFFIITIITNTLIILTIITIVTITRWFSSAQPAFSFQDFMPGTGTKSEQGDNRSKPCIFSPRPLFASTIHIFISPTIHIFNPSPESLKPTPKNLGTTSMTRIANLLLSKIRKHEAILLTAVIDLKYRKLDCYWEQ